MKIVKSSVSPLIMDQNHGSADVNKEWRTKTCSVFGCNISVHVKKSGLCQKHYDQMRHNGKTTRLTNTDLNEFIFEDGVCKMIIRDRRQNEICYAIIDTDDYARVKDYKWGLSKKHVYSKKCGWLHRFVLRKDCNIDHINRNGLDNRKCNLRQTNVSLNAANSKLNSRNKSGFKGVSWFKNAKLWRAYITVNRKFISLGYYKKQKEAAVAYDKAALMYFGNHAATNKELGLL